MSNEITHKELLTFSNLTNLEWEFVDLKAIKEGNTEYQLEGDPSEATYLNNLLTPEVFVREIKNEETGETDDLNIYGSDIEGNYLGEEQGLIEMRQEAGIAMEYLEKQDGEGEFIKDWEVVYAADNYKLVKDYLTSLQKLQERFEDAKGEDNSVKESNSFIDNSREKVANSIESTFGSNAVSKFINPDRSVLFEGGDSNPRRARRCKKL